MTRYKTQTGQRPATQDTRAAAVREGWLSARQAWPLIGRVTQRLGTMGAALGLLLAGAVWAQALSPASAQTPSPVEVPAAGAKVQLTRLASAPVDEWFYGLNDERNRYFGPVHPQAPATAVPPGAQAKHNGSYVWAMTSWHDWLWFSSLSNGWCGWMMVSGQFFPSKTSRWACETFRSSYQDQAKHDPEALWPKDGSALQGDWRPPQVWGYNVRTGELRMAPVKNPTWRKMLSRSFGFRAAGAHDGVVFMASNPLVRADKAVYVAALDGESGEYIDSATLPNYVNVRRFQTVRHPDGAHAMYFLVGDEMHSSDHPSHLLRWVGTRAKPFAGGHSATPGFEVVGDLGQAGAGAEFIEHNGRLWVTTWGSAERAAGLYRSNPMPAGGFTAAQPATFEKVMDASDFDSDPVIARSWLFGALQAYQGHIYWGSMHPTGQAVQKLVLKESRVLLDPSTAVLRAQRHTHVFRVDASNPKLNGVELLYGDERPWRFADGQWQQQPNLLGLKPLYGPAGLGSAYNNYTWTMVNYRGALYLGTFDISGGMEALRQGPEDCHLQCYVLRQWAQHTPATPGQPGFDLFRFDSKDRPAVAVTRDGFGNPASNGLRNALVLGDTLYLGTSSFTNLAGGTGRPGWELLQLKVKP